jgi:hypothetical protein
MDPEHITSDWLSSALGTEVVIADTKRIGDGLVGMNLRFELESPAGSTAPTSLIAKLPSPDPTSRATGVALRNYEREVKFYQQIAPTVDIRVAHCFHAELDETDHDFVLLLEDLAPCEQGNQITGCSVEHARDAVLELARLHGPRWGDPTLDDVDWLQRRGPEDALNLQTMWGIFLPGFFATYSKYLDAEGIALIDRFGERLPDWVDGHSMPGTVTHGDYRLDNLMFASAHGGYPVATVDWQTPGHGQASSDVAYFLGAGPLPEDRREIERGLVGDYLEALGGYGVVVDETEFWHHYVRDTFGGIIMAVVASQIVGSSDRSEAMFAAMATRHTRHALDLDAESLI